MLVRYTVDETKNNLLISKIIDFQNFKNSLKTRTKDTINIITIDIFEIVQESLKKHIFIRGKNKEKQRTSILSL